jgi:hypothetical protein
MVTGLGPLSLPFLLFSFICGLLFLVHELLMFLSLSPGPYLLLTLHPFLIQCHPLFWLHFQYLCVLGIEPRVSLMLDYFCFPQQCVPGAYLGQCLTHRRYSINVYWNIWKNKWLQLEQCLQPFCLYFISETGSPATFAQTGLGLTILLLLPPE